jgi:hypothetical protein
VISNVEPLTFAKNLFQNGIQIFEHVGIEKSNHTATVAFDPHSSTGIVHRFFGMRITVQFDDKFDCDAIEIRDVRRHWRLPSEFVSAQLPVAETLPQDRFRGGRFVAHRAGAFEKSRGDEPCG